MVGNVLVHLGIAVFPTAAVLLVLNTPRLVGSLTHRRKSCRHRRPVECIAADLRRVRRSLVALGPDASVFHRRDTCATYDELLTQACEALAIAHRLDSVDGMDLELERLRVEEELRTAGLIITGS